MSKDRPTFALIPKIINGGIAGMIGVVCVFPLDLVKTRLQNQQIGPRGEKMYDNIADAFRKTYRREGYVGMYKGAAVNILLITPEKAIKLAANDLFRYHLTKPDGQLPIYRQLIAGALAGFCKVSVTTPMELLKIQMQDAGRTASKLTADEKVSSNLSASKVAFDLIKQKGLRGLYKGFAATACRDVTFSALYFPTFAFLNELGIKRVDSNAYQVSEEIPFWHNFLAGMFAGTLAAFSVTPFDVVKTRLQTATKAPGEKHYTGIPDAFVTIMMDEGPLAFFKGGACRVMVIAPLFAIIQVVYFLGVGEYILSHKK